MAGILITPTQKQQTKGARTANGRAENTQTKVSEVASQKKGVSPSPSAASAATVKRSPSSVKLSPTAPEFKSDFSLQPSPTLSADPNLADPSLNHSADPSFVQYPGNGFVPYYYDYSGGFIGEHGSVPPEQWDGFMRAVNACVLPDGSGAQPPVLPMPHEGQGEAFIPYTSGSPPLPFNNQFYAPHAFHIQPPIYPPPVLPPPADSMNGGMTESPQDGAPVGFLPGQMDIPYSQVAPPGFFVPYSGVPPNFHLQHSPLLMASGGPHSVLPVPQGVSPQGMVAMNGSSLKGHVHRNGTNGSASNGDQAKNRSLRNGSDKSVSSENSYESSRGSPSPASRLNVSAEQNRGPRTTKRGSGKNGGDGTRRGASPGSDGGSSADANGELIESLSALELSNQGEHGCSSDGENVAPLGMANRGEKSTNLDGESCLQVNRDDLPVTYAAARFFVIKSFSEDDVHKSIKYGVWTSTPGGNKRLHSSYQEAAALSAARGITCPVFLFYSVNASGQFCGVAEMVSPVDFHRSVGFWQEEERWSGRFGVRWHVIKDIPNAVLRHILVPANDNKPVTNSRDTQEIPQMQGQQMLSIFKNYSARTSILDDFSFYDTRQMVMQERRVARQHQHEHQHDHQHEHEHQHQHQPQQMGPGQVWGQQRYQHRNQRPEAANVGSEVNGLTETTHLTRPVSTKSADAGLTKKGQLGADKKVVDVQHMENLNGMQVNGSGGPTAAMPLGANSVSVVRAKA